MYQQRTIQFSLLLLYFFVTACSGVSVKTDGTYIPTEPEKGVLYDTIARMDSLLFDAFNRRDLEKIKTYFTRDLEFYHDKDGLTDYDHNIKAFQDLFERNNGLHRELVKGTMAVYPLKDQGAIQEGVHRFCHEENGKQDCGSFKFLHIWKKTAEGWKIARVISYGHQ